MKALRYVPWPYVILTLLSTNVLASDLELTPSEIQTRMIGNTVVGVDNGNYYEEYLQANGVILGRDRQNTYRGWWRLDGNKLCFAYEQDDEDDARSKTWDCGTVGLRGDRVTWNDDGTHARLVPGRGLSNLRATAPANPGPQASIKRF